MPPLHLAEYLINIYIYMFQLKFSTLSRLISDSLNTLALTFLDFKSVDVFYVLCFTFKFNTNFFFLSRQLVSSRFPMPLKNEKIAMKGQALDSSKMPVTFRTWVLLELYCLTKKRATLRNRQGNTFTLILILCLPLF